MISVPLPRIGTWAAWRDAARALLAARVPPEDIVWDWDGSATELFATDMPPPTTRQAIRVPADFVEMAQWVVWHKDPQRFARLYALLWRLRLDKGIMADRADPDLARLRQMEKAVHRCKHKMRAFVRFRDLRSDGPRRSFAAWFEPTHHTVEPCAPFFARRFADMDWMIVTPDVTAKFTDGALTFHEGREKPDLPEDAAEALWGTYFKNIFNPARLKISAMTSEMPKKYWKNLPEAQYIPDLIATAEARVREMAETAPTLEPARVARIHAQLQEVPQPASWNLLTAGLAGCTRCPLHGPATQVVPGAGPHGAALMIVGEQPGDQEDLAGTPFVGPAGQLFDQLAARAGFDRSAAYVTNAVKHFKFKEGAKRRLHVNPNASEVSHCKFWLDTERTLLRPRLTLALGATAMGALTGDAKAVMKRRGTIEDTPHGPVLITLHPSALLRMPPAARPEAEAAMIADLQLAVQTLAAFAPPMDQRRAGM
ncbi:UdgX family uracil-DNA binding protein [Loktanella sp. M215]|uniref:UdgX family uracil-DNA binding protein n=1 Tax=Loktanella sp. M215 TaxID=2675431 RepID=UPI001F388769|nr:UdgX family uracil-DNA binding protein [Loktanella sp. M215]MCF7699347.1 UdgX family uracil-DNA binding protein [Loktanella sp. M215]